MIEKNDILKMVKHVFKRGQSVPDKRLLHPKREWGIGIVLASLALAVCAYYQADRFSYYRNIENEIPPNDIRVVTYRSLEMQEVLNEFAERRETYQSLLTDSVVFVSSTTPEVE